jgi:hypothetical protein
MKNIIVIIIMALGCWLSRAADVNFNEVDARFYSVVGYDCPVQGQSYVIAAGQKNNAEKKDNYSAYICLLRVDGNALKKETDLCYQFKEADQIRSSRIRAIRIIPTDTGKTEFVCSGKTGDDQTGKGFLLYGIISQLKIEIRQCLTFNHIDADYTHGYPLALGNLNKEKTLSIVYGGFKGTKHGDINDVRVFAYSEGQLKEKSTPFSDLKIPLRVNALLIDDINKDGSADILIAGRSQQEPGGEAAAFAWYSAGKSYYHLIKSDFPNRLRTILIQDMDGDGQNEIITGGRIELDNQQWLAHVAVWKIINHSACLIGQFRWSYGQQMRLRAFSKVAGIPSQFMLAGRHEIESLSGKKEWFGFIWKFALKNQTLLPMQTPIEYDFGQETRIRDLFLNTNGSLLTTGFGKQDSGGDYAFVCLQEPAK